MNTSSESIPISEIFNFIPINGIPSLEHIAKETNLQRLYINLRLYLQGIELGTHNKQNFSLDFILNQATHENITDICKIIKCALQLQSNTDEYEKIIKNHSMRINLINLKIINTLLSCPVKTEFINSNLLSNYLNYAYTEEEEHKCFVSSILPSFLSKNNKNLEVVWCKCISDKSLTLLSSISSSYLFSEAGIKILQQEQFWELLVHELVASEGFKYKSTMFLLKLSLNILSHYNVTINNKYINNTLLSEDNKSFDYFCILLDISIEKQIHLIQPSLCLLNKMFLPTMWLNIIYKKFLGHSNNTVAFYTLNYFMVNYNDTDLDFGPMFTALNKNDDSKLSKHILHRLQQFCKELSQEKYEKLLSDSLGVNWNPVAFYNFYQHVLVDNKHLDCNITLEIIRNCKKLPHKYIRQGVMFILFTKLKDQITMCEEVSIAKYINIILELMLDEAYYRYATKLINMSKLTVPDEFIQELLGFLSDPNTVNIKIKVDFLIEITERKNVPDLLVKGLYQDFKKRKYATIVLDRLSYLYLVKPSDLQDYLMERLDSKEEAHSIRHMDKPSYDLVSKSIGILTSNKLVSCNQQLLAFEVLFYMTKNNYTVVYNHWFNKILNKSEVILPSLALNFVNLLIKIPTNFGRQHFVRLLNVYEEFFNSQRDDVLVRIYRNFDFIMENIDSRNLSFLEIACNKIFYLKARDDVENSIRYLVRV
ncbi:uncharacterized protein [Atheta coriaria]|uniref:uncharacterized protein n=1 Tax=Dalotia coriaria TaxID=877792 RepID=UPI0031F36292